MSVRTSRCERLGPRGFTLVEVLVVLALLTIILLMAVPTMRRAQVKSATNDGLQEVGRLVDLARTESIKRHIPVGLLLGTDERKVQVWEDWNPADPGAGTNNDHLPNESHTAWLADIRLTQALRLSADYDLNTPFAIWRSDGSIHPGGGGDIELVDRNGNIFRIRVNPLTGSWRLEMRIGPGADDWSPRREKWVWKY